MRVARRVVVVLGACGVLAGCKVDKEPECVEPPKETEKKAAVQTEGHDAKKVSSADADWCRACVVGPHGFMSCQRRSATGSETREQLKEKARIAACTDSGFAADACPPDKIIGLICKGDPEPRDKHAAGNKLLKALKSSGPLVLTKDKEAMDKLKAKMKEKNPGASASAASPEKAKSESGK